MGLLADGIEEFKKLPTAGKVALGGAVAVVVFLAIRARQNAAPSVQGDQSTTGDTPGAATDINQPGGPSTITSTTPTPGPQGPPGPPGPPGKPVAILPPPGKKQPVPRPQLQTYTVRPGDSLSAIASKLGLKGGWNALYNKNKSKIGSNPNLIYSGTVLDISGLR